MNPSDDPLLAALAELPAEIEPPVDLWPSVAVQLPPRRRSLWPRAALLAAAAALIIATSALTTWWLQPEPPGWEVAMVQASAQLEVELAAMDLDPLIQMRIQDNLDTIDTAIADIHRALRAEPDDPVLFAALTTAHRHRLELLQRVTTL
ncbi:MAG: hypothetical protein ACI8RZ_001748 [Myxococcota bacterium]|jgi:hypothetical protein